MAGVIQPLLQEEGVVAEGSARFTPRPGDGGFKAGLVLHHAHPAAAAARRRLHQHRIADLSSGLSGFGGIGDLDGVQRRHAGLLHQRLGRQLVAHQPDDFRSGAQPLQPGVEHRLGEALVFRQKAVAWMHGVGAGAAAGVDDLAHIQVSLPGSASVQGDRAARLPHEGRIGVTIGVHGHGVDAHAVGGAQDAAGNLAAVGNEQPADRLDLHIRHVPNSLVPSTLLL